MNVAVAVDDYQVTLLAPDASGRIDPNDLAQSVGSRTSVVSIIAGHNELGTLQPLDALADAARAKGALFHLDAVQAAGFVDLSPVPWDLLSITAHKLGGPQGVGALVARGRPAIAPVLVGGPQEGGLRPGTVPVALLAGFGAAAGATLACRSREASRLVALRDRLGRAIRECCPEALPIGAWRDDEAHALPHILTFGIEGLRGDELVTALDEAGLAASSSAACLGDARSHVLEAIGVPESVGVVRLSLGWRTTECEIDEASSRIAAALRGLRAMAPFERRRRPFAARAGAVRLALESRHWEAAEAVFTFYQKAGVLPSARHLGRSLGSAADLDRLFPGGLLTVANWLGLPIPQGGCRPGGL